VCRNTRAKRRDFSRYIWLTSYFPNSRQALKKYVLANNSLGNVNDATFTSLFNRALAKGSESGVFARPKGTSSQRSMQCMICRVSMALVF
jgi:hypothetical protein